MCNKTFELSDGSYFVSDIQDYFKYIMRKHQTVTGNRPIKIYLSKIKIRTTFKIKKRYYL